MRTALIGHTGFVGGNLARQFDFDDCYRSVDIESIRGRSYGLIVCAGAPAEKWRANQDPDADAANLRRLIDALADVRADRVELISTVDVYPDPVGVDETSPIDEAAGQAYGRNRRMLERFVQERFEHAIVRLPGLFGPGLKKNVIFDLLHDNQVDRICPESVYQFYDLGRLREDLERVRRHRLALINLATEPTSVREVAWHALGIDLEQAGAGTPVRYDVRTRYAGLFDGAAGYVCDKRAVLEGIRRFAQSQGWRPR